MLKVWHGEWSAFSEKSGLVPPPRPPPPPPSPLVGMMTLPESVLQQPRLTVEISESVLQGAGRAGGSHTATTESVSSVLVMVCRRVLNSEGASRRAEEVERLLR